MQREKRVRNNQAKHSVAQEFQALIIAYRNLASICLRELMRQRSMREGAHQQFRIRESMS